MPRMSQLYITILALTLVSSSALARPEPATRPALRLFDTARHMRVAEVRPGMKGYGLTVLQGTKIERFDVEVISILKNFNPQHDVVLIRCHGANLEHSGSIQGMSGSPVYLKDDAGHERLIGAFAYGWPMMKDPVAGVQPIEYMLELPRDPKPNAEIVEGAAGSSNGPRATSKSKSNERIRWSILDLVPLIKQAAESNPTELTSRAPTNASLQPLASPLMASGLSSKLLDEYGPMFKACHLTMLQSGGGGGVGGLATDTDSNAKIEPGSVLASPLLTGDVELAAVGTCTEVVGDRFVGFGHPFNNEGEVALPVGAGAVNSVIAKLDQSFKIGAAGKVVGTITNDQMVGVGGAIGPVPSTVPIELRVIYEDGSSDRTFHFNAAQHSKFTPLLTSVATSAALSSMRELPQHHTIDYTLRVEFGNGQNIDIANRTVNVSAGTIFMELALPMMAASENPYARVMVKRVTGTMRVTPKAKLSRILSVNLPKLKYRPGEKVKAFVTYRPFRAAEAVMPIEITLPRDLPDGQYSLVVSDWERYLGDEVMNEPFRFSSESVDEVFAVVRDFVGLKHNAIYTRLMRQPDGVAIGRVAMPRLPSSRRQVILGSGRTNTSPFVSSTTTQIDTEDVMNGSADFILTIDSEAHVEVGTSGVGGAGTSRTGVNAAPKPEKKTPAPATDKPEADKPTTVEPTPGGN